MGHSKIKGKDLKKIGYITDKSRSIAVELMNKYYKHESKKEKLIILSELLNDPKYFEDHHYLSKLALEFIEIEEVNDFKSYELKDTPGEYAVYGKKFIDQNTIRQMDMAMSLPVSEYGALMPDAHVGYGLPIGGVLATDNVVIPYGIGLDIGCRMSLTIYPEKEGFITKHRHQIKTALKEQTHFGIGKVQKTIEEHDVLDSDAFGELDLLKKLQGKAQNQLGTSGSGNHFVEVGIVELDMDNHFGLESGNYVGILAHSGSRGLGATIAGFYTRVAMDKCRLPKGAQHMAWLDMNSEEGQEYWLAMNLAGDYAKACHDVIHRKMAKTLGLKPLVKVENHHNFAWKETMEDGKELIVHRKGATPAKVGELGIIPANMKDAGYIVSGLGETRSLNSASHGAGRKMSRGKAKSTFTGSDLKKMLKHTGITLIGGGVDESPPAYKNIEQVMSSQTKLVKVEGKFYPKIVRMDKA